MLISSVAMPFGSFALCHFEISERICVQRGNAMNQCARLRMCIVKSCRIATLHCCIISLMRTKRQYQYHALECMSDSLPPCPPPASGVSSASPPLLETTTPLHFLPPPLPHPHPDAGSQHYPRRQTHLKRTQKTKNLTISEKRG